MANSKSYIETIGNFIRDKVNTLLATELGLVNVMYGSLKQVFWVEAEGAEGLVNEAPSVFVLPETSDATIRTINAQRWSEDVTFRIVYVDKVAEGVSHDANRTRGQRIRDVLIEDPSLATISFANSNAQGIVMRSVRCEFYPIEDAYVSTVNAQLLAVAVIVNFNLMLTNVST